MTSLVMRRATLEDAASVMNIIEDGRHSIASLGIDQWQHGYPNKESVERDIARSACYVAENEQHESVGTLALCRGVDPEYSVAAVRWLTDNPSVEPVPYLAIHRCATAASALNHGVMSFMFAQAFDIACEHGYASVRIDTHPGNKAMRSFLDKQGFSEIGAFKLNSAGRNETTLTRIAYERLLA